MTCFTSLDLKAGFHNISKATRKLHEGKYDIRDKKLPVLAVLVNSSNYSRG